MIDNGTERKCKQCGKNVCSMNFVNWQWKYGGKTFCGYNCMRQYMREHRKIENNVCDACGIIIPEGVHICINCRNKINESEATDKIGDIKL